MEPSSFPSDEPLRIPVWVWWIVTLVAIVGLWAMAIRGGVASQNVFGSPSSVGRWLTTWFLSGEALPHVADTIAAALVGYAIGITAGAITAVVFVFVPGVAPVFEPYMALLNAVPRIVLAPIFILLLGTGLWSKAAVGALIVFFITFFNLYGGLRSVEGRLIDNARVLGASGVQMGTNVYIPAMVSWIMSTLRVGIGFAFVGAIVGEFVGGNRGIGFIINLGQQMGQPELIMGGLATLGVIGAVVDRVLYRIELRFTSWRVF